MIITHSSVHKRNGLDCNQVPVVCQVVLCHSNISSTTVMICGTEFETITYMLEIHTAGITSINSVTAAASAAKLSRLEGQDFKAVNYMPDIHTARHHQNEH